MSDGIQSGTPRTLLGAIENGIVVEDIKTHVVDFLAQKFTAAMLKYPEQEETLMDLFRRITE